MLLMIFILCDKIDCGKSTFIAGLCKDFACENLNISGWYTPSYIERGRKIGHDFVAINNGSTDEPIPYTRPHEFDRSFQWRKYFFNKLAFKKARLLNFNCDLFVVDEIGPLELDDKQGFFQIMNRFFSEPKHTLLVVRKSLKDRIGDILSDEAHEFFELHSSDQLAKKLAETIS